MSFDSMRDPSAMLQRELRAQRVLLEAILVQLGGTLPAPKRWTPEERERARTELRTVRPEDAGAYPTSTTTRERFWSRRE